MALRLGQGGEKHLIVFDGSLAGFFLGIDFNRFSLAHFLARGTLGKGYLWVGFWPGALLGPRWQWLEETTALLMVGLLDGPQW